MSKLRLLISGAVLVLAACANDGDHKPVVSDAGGGGSAKAAGGAPGFSEVQAVFVKNCNACHPSKQPSDWMNYETSKAAAASGLLTRRVVTEKSMPQKGSAQEASMTAGERDLIARWVRAGAPKVAQAPSAQAAGEDGGAGAPSAPVDPRYAAIQTCTGCHGTPPAGPSDQTIPRLAGQNADYLLRRLNIFKHSDPWDQSSPMNKIAFGLTGEEIRATAHAFAASPGLNAATPTVEAERRPLFTRGQFLAGQQCVMCHLNAERNGGTNDPLIPVLAGQNEDYVRGQLYAFRSGARASKGMYEYAAPLTDYDIEALSVYFAQTRAPVK